MLYFLTAGNVTTNWIGGIIAGSSVFFAVIIIAVIIIVACCCYCICGCKKETKESGSGGIPNVVNNGSRGDRTVDMESVVVPIDDNTGSNVQSGMCIAVNNFSIFCVGLSIYNFQCRGSISTFISSELLESNYHQ